MSTKAKRSTKSTAKKTKAYSPRRNRRSLKLTAVQAPSKAKNWQQCKPENLTELFYAYNDSSREGVFSNLTQRVLAYKMATGDIAKMFKAYQPGTSIITFHMGSSVLRGNDIPNEPGFTPFIQLYNPGMNNYSNCFELAWDPVPPFQLGALGHKKSTTSMAQVTPAAADLFVVSWVNQARENVADAFESTIQDSYTARVKCYNFNENDTDKIFTTIDGAINPSFYVLLGLELTSQLFPYAFRPVISVNYDDGSPISKGGPETMTNYFEFASPCPPYCRD